MPRYLLLTPTTPRHLGGWFRFRTVTAAVREQLKHGGELYIDTPTGPVAWADRRRA